MAHTFPISIYIHKQLLNQNAQIIQSTLIYSANPAKVQQVQEQFLTLHQLYRLQKYQINIEKMIDPEIISFESELKNKIQFKASSRVSNDAVLFKAFKFYDLYNNGFLSRADFFKAIAKCGVVVDTHNLDTVYRHYDQQNTGKIDYRAFIEKLLFSGSSEGQSENMEKSQVSLDRKPEKSNYQQEAHESAKKIQKVQQQHSPSDKLKQSRYHKEPQTFEQTLQIITTQLRGDGIYGLLNLATQLKSTDYNRTHLINQSGLAPCFPYLSPKAQARIVSQYNPNKFGEINYAELIYGLKGNMNLQRQALIDDLFNMLDVEQKGEVEIARLVGAYRNRSEIGAFKRAVDLYCKFQSIDDGVFTDEDFNDFFEFLSFSFRDDLQFSQFIKIGFYSEEPPKSTSSQRSRRQFQMKKQNSNRQTNQPTDFRKNKAQELPEEPIKKTGTFNQQDFYPEDQKSHVSAQSRRSEAKSHSHVEIPQVKEINMIFLRMKKTLASKGTRGFLQFEKLLKLNDTDNDGRVTLDQFKQVIKQQKIDITPLQALQIFSIFDSNKTNSMDFQQIIQTLKGQLPQPRNALIHRMWQRVKNDEQHTTLSKLKSCLNFRSHPDIQTGRKYDDQVWNQIQETILMIQELSGQVRSDTVYKEVFLEYAENLSLSIAEDQLFQSVAQNFWKIGSSVKIEEEYAGSRKVFDPKKSAYLQDHHRYAYNGGSVSQNAPFGTFNIPTNYTTEHHKL